MIKRVIYPGTFDPITNGHLDVIKRASAIFEEVIVAVSISQEKKPLFSLADREAMITLAIKGLPNVRVMPFETLLVTFVRQQGAKAIVRGLRAVSDFEYELQMGYANESLDPTIETVYLMPSLQYAFISSSVVRAILHHKGPVSHLVPAAVNDFIIQKGLSVSGA
ncbi:MAG: pantetheine-phosphate adenylyltransferase [Campylobacterales bacterium]